MTATIGEVYDRTAPFYLSLTEHDDYGIWAAALDRLIRHVGPPGHRLLDIGCGAGRSSVHLAELGWTVTGVDASAGMIELARRRHGDTGIDFVVHDARTPFAHDGFDVVNCMSDVVNYQTTDADLAALLGSCAAALRPGGVLVFDVNTRANYLRAESSDAVLEPPGAFLSWRTRRDPDRPGGWRLTLDAFTDDGFGWSRRTVEHEQTCHSPESIEAALRTAGLTPGPAWTLDQRGRVSTTPDPAATKLLLTAHRQN